MMKKHLLWLLALFLTAGCTVPATPSAGGIRVLATTTIAADVVAQVGGEHIHLTTLLPVGSDPHTYAARPQDVAALTEAEVIFMCGAGLENFLPRLVESAGVSERVVDLSQGVALMHLGEAGGDVDPHTWMDPQRVITWTQNVDKALAAADPVHASEYHANAAAYIRSLQELDAAIETTLAEIPRERRLLVSDHAALGYFASRYGFDQVGSITGTFSSESAPNAQELAAIEDEMIRSMIPAIFLTEQANATIVEQVARDVGVPVIWLQVASLTDASGVAPTYIQMMQYNASSIADSLK